jgi:hypothetical protein
MEGQVQQANEIDSMIQLEAAIADQDECIIAALMKGEDTAQLEAKVAADLLKLNGLRAMSSHQSTGRTTMLGEQSSRSSGEKRARAGSVGADNFVAARIATDETLGSSPSLSLFPFMQVNVRAGKLPTTPPGP